MSALILHHYNESPYAEKVRALLGYKGLAWRSVIVPRIAPKPDMVALTGGYRKVPVLQVGADVYCDTRLIAEALDNLALGKPVAAAAGTFSEVVENWVDVNLFGRAVAFTFGQNVDHLPEAFLADRAALRGAPLDRSALKAAVPMAAQELAAHIGWVDKALCGPHSFVNGATPGIGDFTLYSTLWFARNGRLDFTPFPAVAAWMDRMKAFGHGEPTEFSAAEALDVAASHEPAALPAWQGGTDASGLTAGQRVTVSPELLGHGTDVPGELVALSPYRITLRVRSERCGTVHVHFPRLGYRLRASN